MTTSAPANTLNHHVKTKIITPAKQASAERGDITNFSFLLWEAKLPTVLMKRKITMPTISHLKNGKSIPGKMNPVYCK